MEKIVLSMHKEIPATIFEEREIKRKINHLFKQENETIKKRYNEIKNSFEQKEIRNINFSTIRDLFKEFFLQKVVEETILTLFEDESKDSLSKTLLISLTWESLMESIYGEEMISAFKKAIRTIPGPVTFIRGQAMLLLKKRFSVFNPYSRKLEKVNHCTGCGCYCRCDGNCEGDTKKCTSPRAKNCNHHCDCWIFPLAMKRRKEEGNRVINTEKKS